MYFWPFDSKTIMTDALQYFLNLTDKSIMEDRILEFDMAKVALTIITLLTGLAFLISIVDT